MQADLTILAEIVHTVQAWCFSHVYVCVHVHVHIMYIRIYTRLSRMLSAIHPSLQSSVYLPGRLCLTPRQLRNLHASNACFLIKLGIFLSVCHPWAILTQQDAHLRSMYSENLRSTTLLLSTFAGIMSEPVSRSCSVTFRIPAHASSV
jgi:hypothetical protein